ncbi:DNA polymerase, partial [Pseudoalteromonas marina]|uniref:DNA polymerase n=1 Tax=Pseudoalteromonas marina TaxID=267375 RepID=UPI003C42B316
EETDTGLPSTSGDTLEKLKNLTDSEETKGYIQALMDFNAADKVLGTFIPALEGALPTEDGIHRLFGNFNLAGTISGRMSSNDPNLMNLPSGSKYGKAIKRCFNTRTKGNHPEWLWVCADFPALEERVNALLTRDPNKMKVYSDGYDGHSLRTKAYWPDKFAHLSDSVEDVNSIQTTDGGMRSKSKTVSFALQYGGTWNTLVSNSGFTPIEAKRIVNNYDTLYEVSKRWMDTELEVAATQGYATGAFGLRIRCPTMSRYTWRGMDAMPHNVKQEARSIGNALGGQSYGLLNNRAMNEVMENVYSDKLQNDIIPISLIHDALYFMVRNDVRTLKYSRKLIKKAMAWQKLPELHHDAIGFEVDVEAGISWDSVQII